ncbi:hypothetical protein [Pseudovibrio sp. SPO723]|uniref:hypothetical protein n=1 Tax=Nesiotobacter zosterae TaxID=392721 RepID=UPI0029C49305|nr:hypothetical protein [Pseudovibrio sp. SPO723]MDX5592564.1 hypothetical protein [Pseudovibrio sp. SPO723]
MKDLLAIIIYILAGWGAMSMAALLLSPLVDRWVDSILEEHEALRQSEDKGQH